MNSKQSQIPDLFVSTIRSINSQTPKDWSIERRTLHPKAIQEELYKFITELMLEWKVEDKWGGIEKINIPKNMSRFASTYYGLLRFKNRKAHSIIAEQLNGILFNDGRLSVELNRYPPREIHLQFNSELAFKYNPQLKQRYDDIHQTKSNENSQSQRLNHPHVDSQDNSDEEFDIVSVHDPKEQARRLVEKTDTDTQVDTVTEELEKTKETVQQLTDKLSRMELQLQEANDAKLQLKTTVKDQAKKIGDLSEENQKHCKVINKLKIAFLSTE